MLNTVKEIKWSGYGKIHDAGIVVHNSDYP